MQGTIIGNGLDHDCTIPAPGSSKASHRLLSDRLQSYIGCVIIIAASFLADIVLPRGATPAIGYCLVPALARAAGQRLLFFLTGICTALTWIGYILEPAGAAWWMSVFDRAMVTGVLWLALLLVWRRLQAESALARQTEALREAVRELHRSNAELENFASIVSHDLRGPLNSIALAIRIISSQPAIHSDPECNQWIDSIVAEIARISSLIQRLLAYGRIGAGEATLSDCDCESVLNSVRQALRAQVEDAGAQITNDPLPTIRADPALMTELLQNLVENSIKYRSSMPPHIHVSATRTTDGWLFSERDNGIGMNAADCARAFDAFYRGKRAGSAAGVGLGLATCKRIVDRHGGRIEVQSSPSNGSTFTFFIPSSPSN